MSALIHEKTFLFGGSKRLFQVYKCGLAIYLVSLLIYGCITQQYNPKLGKEEYWYTGLGGLLLFNNT